MQFFKKAQKVEYTPDDKPVSYIPRAYHKAVYDTAYDACSVWGIGFDNASTIYTATLKYAGRKIDWQDVSDIFHANGLRFTQDVANALNMTLEHSCAFVHNAEWAQLGR